MGDGEGRTQPNKKGKEGEVANRGTERVTTRKNDEDSERWTKRDTERTTETDKKTKRWKNRRGEKLEMSKREKRLRDEDRKTGGRGREGGGGKEGARERREIVAGGGVGSGTERGEDPRARPAGLTKVKGVFRSVIIRSATARLTMKRLVAECIRWFLKMT